MQKNRNFSVKIKTEYYILTVFSILIILSLYFSLTSPLTRTLMKNEIIYGLVIGSDNIAYAQRADTIILLSYLPKEHFLNLLSIPRDTRINSWEIKNRRINEVYTHGIEVFKTTIEDLLSSEEKKVSIPYYCELNYSAFIKIINILGGIPIKIDKVMDYHDNWGNLHIHFEPGEYVLNGQKALEYVRYRDETGDTERIVRQQRFLRNLFNRIKNPLIFFRLPLLLKETVTSLKTNLSVWDMLALALEGKNISTDNLRILNLPGAPKSNLWIPEKERINSVTDLLSLGKVQEIKPKRENSTEELIVPTVTAEVWNATERQGLALEMTRFLRRRGVDVVKWGNYGERKKSTLIIDRTGNFEKTEKLTNVLPGYDLVTHLDPKRMVDLTIILGEDCLKNISFLE